MTLKALGIFLRVKVLRQSSLAARPEVSDWAIGDTIWFDVFGFHEGDFLKLNSRGRIICKNYRGKLFEQHIWQGYNRTIWLKEKDREREAEQDALRETIIEPPTEMPNYIEPEPVPSKYQVGSWREN